MSGFDLAAPTALALSTALLAAACAGPRGGAGMPASGVDAATQNEAGSAGEPVAAAEAGTEAGRPAAGEQASDAAAAGDAASDAAPDAASDAAAMMTLGPAFRTHQGTTWEGTGTWAVEIELAEPAPRPLSLTLMTSGTAEAMRDFQLESSTLQIPAGSRSVRASIRIVDDQVREDSETLVLRLAGSEPPESYQLRIGDDDDERWPDDSAVRAIDAEDMFPDSNFSGLAYQPAANGGAALWMVRNSPSTLYRLVEANGVFAPAASGGWAQAKTLVYPGGSGAPDAEDLTWAEWSSSIVYVVSERDGNGPSAPSVLAYDTAATGATLRAQQVWDLSADLRAIGLDSNMGPEGLTWVPDSYLTGAGFVDQRSGAAYVPARYPNHGSGLFFVGIEQTGGIYVYALDHQSGAATRVAVIDSGQPGMMALAFDRDVNYLWAWCDDRCGNRASVLRVEDNPASPRAGQFVVRRRLQHPVSLPDLNHEGMSLGPAAECVATHKSVFWVEDGDDEHVLRRGAIPCAAFLDP
jgi:hypothetical protein